MSTKPLHVQVAEALGWTWCHDRGDGLWLGSPDGGPNKEIPGYGVTACATGPLIERFKILLGPDFIPTQPDLTFTGFWSAKIGAERLDATIARAGSPWGAVGNLIVELKEKGKLNG